jgi:hypothetical protein
MDMHRTSNRGTAVLLAVALATSLLAPAAEAGHRRPHRRGPVVIERHSDAGAVIGFLGGLVLGTVIANAQAPPSPVCERAGDPDYDYYDPWCRESFGTLDRYERHLDRHRHPRRAEVVDERSGRCVDTVRWYEGRWISDGEQARAADEDAPPYEEWDD